MPDMIAYWAKQTPDAVALTDGADMSYRMFDAAINKAARALQAFNLPEQGLVALRISGLKGLYILERALDRLGLATVALSMLTPPEAQLELLKPAVVLTMREGDAALHPNTVLVTDEWFLEAMKGPPVPPPDHRPRPEDLARVMVSSGTTGRPKVIPITRASLAARNQTNQVIAGFSWATRLMVVMGPQAIGGFVAPYATWTVGGAVTLHGRASCHADILRLRPNQIWLSTGQLESLLDEIPPGAPVVSGLRVTVMGGQVFKTLVERTRRRLSEDVWILYGSTEIGVVTHAPAAVLERHPRAVGYAWPTITADIVGEDGASRPPGEVGEVRMRAERIFSGYVGETETASSPWRDGWFYPGDLGALGPDGLLIIHGRTAEVMDLGGYKIDPGAVDEVARTCPGVADAAAFSIADEVGIERPWIAVVPGEGFDPAGLVSGLQARWPALREVKIAFIDALPRNSMAKVERHRLKALVRDAMDGRGAPVN